MLLTASQLRELGLQSMGEIATVRAACQAHVKGICLTLKLRLNILFTYVCMHNQNS